MIQPRFLRDPQLPVLIILHGSNQTGLHVVPGTSPTHSHPRNAALTRPLPGHMHGLYLSFWGLPQVAFADCLLLGQLIVHSTIAPPQACPVCSVVSKILLLPGTMRLLSYSLSSLYCKKSRSRSLCPSCLQVSYCYTNRILMETVNRTFFHILYPIFLPQTHQDGYCNLTDEDGKTSKGYISCVQL